MKHLSVIKKLDELHIFRKISFIINYLAYYEPKVLFLYDVVILISNKNMVATIFVRSVVTV